MQLPINSLVYSHSSRYALVLLGFGIWLNYKFSEEHSTQSIVEVTKNLSDSLSKIPLECPTIQSCLNAFSQGIFDNSKNIVTMFGTDLAKYLSEFAKGYAEFLSFIINQGGPLESCTEFTQFFLNSLNSNQTNVVDDFRELVKILSYKITGKTTEQSIRILSSILSKVPVNNLVDPLRMSSKETTDWK